MSSVLVGAIAAAVVSSAQIDHMFENCVFMRSVRFSNPSYPGADEMFNECAAHLDEETRLQARKEWYERWLEQHRKDKLLESQIQREKENREIRWSGCSPVWVVDRFGRPDFATSKQLMETLCK